MREGWRTTLAHRLGLARHAVVRRLPIGGLIALHARVLVPSIRRQMRVEGVAPPPFVPLAEHANVLSTELLQAVERAGGTRAVDASLEWMERSALATSMALMAKGHAGWGGSVDVDGFPGLAHDHREGRPIFVVEPHIGPWWFVTGHLLVSGLPVSAFSAAPPVEIRSFRRLADALMASNMAPDAFREIRVPDPRSALTAIQDGSSGRVLIWHPASAFMGATRSADHPFLGGTVRVSPAIARVVRRLNAAVYLAHARLERGLRPRLRLWYRRLDMDLSDEGTTIAGLYGAIEESILANVDQWMMWRFFPDGLGWSPTSEAGEDRLSGAHEPGP